MDTFYIFDIELDCYIETAFPSVKEAEEFAKNWDVVDFEVVSEEMAKKDHKFQEMV